MDEIKNKIKGLEEEMQKADFWGDKARAQEVIKELGELKERLIGGDKYDKGDAVLTLLPEAGGDDAEDWARILFEMYAKFANKKGWMIKFFMNIKASMADTKMYRLMWKAIWLTGH